MKKPDIPPPHRASVIESNSGKLAVIICRGVGNNPGSQIQEICKDGRFSKRDPYWIKGSSRNWKSKGSCLITYLELNEKVAYGLSDFQLYETKAPYNPDGVLFPYEVVYKKAGQTKGGCLGMFFAKKERDIMVVMASSGEDAKRRVARKGIGMVYAARPTRLTEDTVIEPSD